MFLASGMNSARPGVSKCTPSKTINHSDCAFSHFLTTWIILFGSLSSAASLSLTHPLGISFRAMRRNQYSSSCRDLARTQYTPPG